MAWDDTSGPGGFAMKGGNAFLAKAVGILDNERILRFLLI